MNFLTKTLSVFMIIAIFSSCASIVSKSKWPLTINTNPNGAKIEITDKQGIVVYNGNTPSTIKLKSGDGFFVKQSYKIKLSLNGYEEKILPVECKLNGWYIGNIVFGGLIGWLIVDPVTGAMYRLDKAYINETFTKTTVSTEPSLKILNINELPAEMSEHLISLK
jgi:hypothetical protein